MSSNTMTTDYIRLCLQNAVRNHVSNGHPERADNALNVAAIRFIELHGARECLRRGPELLDVLELWEREARG